MNNNDFSTKDGKYINYVSNYEPVEISLDKIVPNRFQPRLIFNDVKLEELADSIKRYGILSPVLLRKLSDEKYEILAGERRVRAAELANLKKVPAIVGDFNDFQMMELSIIENIQREELNPIEEAKAFETLAKFGGLSQSEIGVRIGKSRPYISNTMRLLNLPAVVQQYVVNGILTTGQVKPLIGLDNDTAIDIANRAIDKGWSARQIEALTHLKKGSKQKLYKPKNPIYGHAAKVFKKRLDTKVKINDGLIKIYFKDDDDLKSILEKLG